MLSNLNDIFDKSLNRYKKNNIKYHEKKQNDIVNAKLVDKKIAVGVTNKSSSFE